MTMSSRTLVTTTASCMVIAISSSLGTAARAESPVLGTIGLDSSGAWPLTAIQDAAHGEWFGGKAFSWWLSVHDTVVPKMISDFDPAPDGYDDFIIRSGWGIGIVGNDAGDNLVLKAAAPYGTDIGEGWILSAGDEVVAVGRFGRAEAPAQMVLKGTTGFAFVRAHEEGGLQAMTVVPYGNWITGDGFGWLVGPGDKVIGVGRLNGIADGLVVMSNWGMGVWAPQWIGAPTLLSIHQNGTEFQAASARTWQLDTEDPRFRLLDVSDIDIASDNRAEMILVSSSGLAVLHENGSGVWGSEPLDLRLHVPDGEALSEDTGVIGTLHWLVNASDFSKDRGADVLFQHEDGITILGKSGSAWSFKAVANQDYGSWIGGWSFGGDDLLLPLAGDLDGDGQNDLPITSGWGVGVLTISGSLFKEIGLAPYESLPITSADQLVGVGKFDHSGRRRLLFKNNSAPAAPTRPAVLTYHNDNARTGLNPNERCLTPAKIGEQGLRLQFQNHLGGVIDGDQERVFAQVMYVPDLAVDFDADGLPDDGSLHDAFFVVTDKNNLYAWDANTGGWLYGKRFKDRQDEVSRSLGGRHHQIGGIQSTPVIDYSTKTMYIVYATMNRPQRTGGEDPDWDVAYWLVAWDLQTARTLRGVRIAGSYPRSDGSSVEFLARNHAQRPALLLSEGSVYIAFSSRWQEEAIEYHGWVFRYDTATFEQLGVFNTSPNEKSGYPSRGAGIWQGGGGLAADETGQVYLITGNGPVDIDSGTYGDFFLKFAPRGYTLQLRKAFTPKNPGQYLDIAYLQKDWDLGAGGPLLMPGTDRVLGGGKEGMYHIINRNTFTRVQDDLQAFTNLYDPNWRTNAQWAGGPHLHGNPAYWRGPTSAYGYVYQQAEMDYLKAYKYEFSKGRLDDTPIVASDRRITPQAVGEREGMYMTNQLSVSSDGNREGTGVVWATLPARTDDPNDAPDSVTNRLTAYNAENLQALWSTDITGTGDPAHMPKSTPPTIADGKVFIANNNNEVRVYWAGCVMGRPPR
jgi:hypothetical protein